MFPGQCTGKATETDVTWSSNRRLKPICFVRNFSNVILLKGFLDRRETTRVTRDRRCDVSGVILGIAEEDFSALL